MDADHDGLPSGSTTSVENAQPASPAVPVGRDGLPITVPDKGTGDNVEPGVEIGKDGLPVTTPDSEQPFDRIHMEEEDEGSESQVKKKGFLATSMNLLNSLLGAGILSVPSTFADTGYIGSLVILIIIAALSYYATYLVIVSQDISKADGFSDLAYRTYGKIGYIILDVLTLLFLVSASLAYIIIAGDIILSWFAFGGKDLSALWPRAITILIYACCIPIALTIPRDISFLSYFSTATVTFILFYACVLVVKSCIFMKKNHGINHTCFATKFDITLFNTISICALTFALPCVCIPSLELFSRDVKKRSMVSMFTIFLCSMFVIFPSIFSYFQFGNQTQGNILNSFPNSDILMVVTRGVFFFVVSFAFPMISQSTMSVWSALIFKIDQQRKLPWKKRIVILLVTDGIPLVIAMFMKESKPILGIGGAIGGCLANFTFPALMYIKESKERWFHWTNICAIAFAVFGIIAGVLSTYVAVLDAIRAFSKNK